MSRRSRFYGQLWGKPKEPSSVCGADYLTFRGGGWGGFVNVEVSTRRVAPGQAEVDWVRVYVTDHPDQDQSHLTELYSGPLDAAAMRKNTKLHRVRLVKKEGREEAARILHQSNLPVRVYESQEDPFYHDVSGLELLGEED